MKKFLIIGFFIAVFVVLIYIGVTFLAMLAWNYIVTYFHHRELILNFWVTLLILALLSIIGGIFRGNTDKK